MTKLKSIGMVTFLAMEQSVLLSYFGIEVALVLFHIQMFSIVTCLTMSIFDTIAYELFYTATTFPLIELQLCQISEWQKKFSTSLKYSPERKLRIELYNCCLQRKITKLQLNILLYQHKCFTGDFKVRSRWLDRIGIHCNQIVCL